MQFRLWLENDDRVFSRDDILKHILSTNSPLKRGERTMTPEEWAERYLSQEPEGYVLMNVHPNILVHPKGFEARHLDSAKAAEFAKLSALTQAPIVIDSNKAMQARAVYDEMGGYGLASFMVVDGKHRVRASQLREDKSIQAYVPKHRVKDLMVASHEAEVLDFAKSWCERKGFKFLGASRNSYGIEASFEREDGRKDAYSQWRWEEMAGKLGVKWLYN
jgi:hypothetical protein